MKNSETIQPVLSDLSIGRAVLIRHLDISSENEQPYIKKEKTKDLTFNESDPRKQFITDILY